MCEIDSKVIDNSDGTCEAFITCKISGKPISVSNEWGMFCEDLCQLEENKKAHGDLKNFLESFMKQMGIE